MGSPSGSNEITYSIVIRDLIESMIFPDLVADELLKRWRSPLLDLESREEIGRFLVAHGFGRSLVSICCQDIENGREIPLYPFAKALRDIDFDKKDDLVSEIANFYYKKNASHLLVLAKSFHGNQKADSLKKALSAFTKGLVSAKQQRIDHLIQEISEKAKGGDVKAEKDLIDSLMALAPEEPHLDKLILDWKMRWASEIFDQDKLSVNELDSSLSEAEKNHLLEASRELLMKNEFFFDSIPLFFVFAGEEPLAADLLISSLRRPLRQKDHFLFLEILIAAKKPILALAEIKEAQVLYGHQPEWAIGLQYLQAVALSQLGQTHSASDIFKEIQKRIPGYRATEIHLHRLRDNSP